MFTEMQLRHEDLATGANARVRNGENTLDPREVQHGGTLLTVGGLASSLHARFLH